MAPVIPFLGIISAAIGAVAAIQQGRAADRAAKYNAQIAEQNATVARQQASAAAEQQRRENVRRLGSIRANVAGSGLSLEGSALDILEESATEAELQRQNIIYEGEVRATGQQGQAALSRAEGRTARTTGYLRAGSSLLGAATEYYTQNPLKRG